MASFRVARRAFCASADVTSPPVSVGRWERLRNSKAGVWCRSLLSDYKEACKEIVVGARDRPLEASVYMGLLGGAYACFITKPDQLSFQVALVDRSNRLALLSPWIRNANSDVHVQNLVKLKNQGCLRHLSLGLFSLVYSAEYDHDSALYEARCSNLSVPWRELPERVLDVGFVGRWWILEKKMEDFDVNEAEYKHLPAHMQATAPPSVQEVERNEQLHRESWLPLSIQKECERSHGEEKTMNVQDQTSVSKDINVDRPVVETLKTHGLCTTLDLKMDSEIMETENAKADSEIVEQLNTQGDSQAVETLDEQVDCPVAETLYEQVDSQVVEVLDEQVDSQNVDTLVDMQVGSNDAETLDPEELARSRVIKEDTVAVDIMETHVDSEESPSTSGTVDPEMVESVDRQEDGVSAEVKVEPVQHSTTPDGTA